MEYEINSFILRWRKYTDYYKCTILLYYTYIIILIVNKNTDIQLYSKKTNHQKGKTKMAIINLWWVNGNFWRWYEETTRQQWPASCYFLLLFHFVKYKRYKRFKIVSCFQMIKIRFMFFNNQSPNLSDSDSCNIFLNIEINFLTRWALFFYVDHSSMRINFT